MLQFLKKILKRKQNKEGLARAQTEKEILEELLKEMDKKEFEKDYTTGTAILAYNRVKNDFQKIIEQKLKENNY